MVFDEAVVNSLTSQAAAHGPPACDGQPGREGPTLDPASLAEDAGAQTDATLPLHHRDRQSDAAATGNTAVADANVSAGTCSKAEQHQDRCPDVGAEAELSNAVPDTTVHQADRAWQAVLQRSMQLAQDTRWTHKGLQVSAACLSTQPFA